MLNALSPKSSVENVHWLIALYLFIRMRGWELRDLASAVPQLVAGPELTISKIEER